MSARRLLAAAALITLSSTAHARIQEQDFQNFAFRQHPGAQVPLDAQLRDEIGRPVELRQVLGHEPSVLVLEYLKCRNLCSLVLRSATSAIAKGGLEPGSDLQFVAVSIDPRDTPADAAAARAMYSRQFPPTAARGLHFLTGSPSEVGRIASAVGFPYRYDRQSGQFAHPAGFVVLTPEGRISRYMLGLGQSPGDLARAVAQAREDWIKPPAYPLLCLCFGYDPDEGSVAALAWRLTRIVALVAMLCCAALLFMLSRRRRSA
jgi:protein SCO1/2